jgi:hypothetical protein
MFFLIQFSVIEDRDAETPAEIQLRAALHACITGRLQSWQCVCLRFRPAQGRCQELEAILRKRGIWRSSE